MVLTNIVKTKYGVDAKSTFKLLNANILVSMESMEDITFSEECLVYANSLPEKVINKLCEASIRYCNDFLDAIGEPIIEFSVSSDVLKLIRPSVLIIPEKNDKYKNIFHMELNCDWEEEHGLEWLVRDDEVLYVGAFNGESEWENKNDYQASWNFV